MKPEMSVSVRSGSHQGSIAWDRERSTFQARFDLFAGVSIADPCEANNNHRVVDPYEFALGRAVAEFVTFDRLSNQLEFDGLPLSPASRQVGEELRSEVSSKVGDVEVVGLAGQYLCLVLPGEVLVPIRPEIDGEGHRHGWGSPGRAAMRSARVIVRHVWSAAYGEAEESLAGALVAVLLGGCGPDFSLNANSICDWFMFGARLFTKYDRHDYLALWQRYAGDCR